MKKAKQPDSEPIARVVAGVLLFLLSNYWHTIGVGVDQAEKLMRQMDEALAKKEGV